MVKITYHEHDGTSYVVDVAAGMTVMEGAKANGVAGILADCGGVCACATCHVYIEGEWAERVTPSTEDESIMLDLAFDRRPSSRLSCQITVSQDLEGMDVFLPIKQNL